MAIMIFQWIENHVLLCVLLLAAIFTFLWLLRFRQRLRMTWWAALLLSILHVLYGVACVRVFARFEGAGVGAMSIFGAVFFMPLGYFLGAKLFKRSAAEVFDIFAIPMIFTLLCSRINCLAAGCCIGLPIGGTGFRWPTREAEMLFYLVFLAIEAPKVLRGRTKGEVYPLYMLCYGAFRAVVECFRYSAATNHLFHLSHVWAVLSLAVGLAIFAEIKNHAARNPRKAKKH